VAFLRIPKFLQTRKLYSKLRQQYNERTSSSARLMADIRSLYCLSVAVLHLLACVWYFMTEGQPAYDDISEYSLLGTPTGNDVSAYLNIFCRRVFFALLPIDAEFTSFPRCYQDGGGPFAMRFYIYCVGIVIYVISSQGLPTNIRGTSHEVWFLTFTIFLNLSFWAYLMGSISGRYPRAPRSMVPYLGGLLRHASHSTVMEQDCSCRWMRLWLNRMTR